MSENGEETPDDHKPEVKPLSTILPSTYKDVDVTEIFPDFRRGKVILITMS